MAIQNYSLVKGKPVRPGQVSGKNPHYRFSLGIGSGSAEVQVDVDVHSEDGSDIRYLIVSGFTPPNDARLEALPLGMTPLTGDNAGLRLDYVKEMIDGAPMVDPSKMVDLPLGDVSDPLHNAVSRLLDAALADSGGTIYVFGSWFSDSGQEPGIHDIHMNQGNPPGRFASENGAWQDGALFIELPDQAERWTALFIAFETESFQTDANGNPI